MLFLVVFDLWYMWLIKVCVAVVFHLHWVFLGVDVDVVVRGDVV